MELSFTCVCIVCMAQFNDDFLVHTRTFYSYSILSSEARETVRRLWSWIAPTDWSSPCWGEASLSVVQEVPGIWSRLEEPRYAPTLSSAVSLPKYEQSLLSLSVFVTCFLEPSQPERCCNVLLTLTVLLFFILLYFSLIPFYLSFFILFSLASLSLQSSFNCLILPLPLFIHFL
jgi:hypothetical protein